MKESLYDRLWRRECGDSSSYAGLRGIYGGKEWVENLDIVNELGGHTGCVNALRYLVILADTLFISANQSQLVPIRTSFGLGFR
jgi:hypothetical protein